MGHAIVTLIQAPSPTSTSAGPAIGATPAAFVSRLMADAEGGLVFSRRCTSRASSAARLSRRWYDYQGIEPLFAFGHGPSYTKFEHSDLVVATAGDGFEATFTVRNTGARGGSDVHNSTSDRHRPPRCQRRRAPWWDSGASRSPRARRRT